MKTNWRQPSKPTMSEPVTVAGEWLALFERTRVQISVGRHKTLAKFLVVYWVSPSKCRNSISCPATTASFHTISTFSFCAELLTGSLEAWNKRINKHHKPQISNEKKQENEQLTATILPHTLRLWCFSCVLGFASIIYSVEIFTVLPKHVE